MYIIVFEGCPSEIDDIWYIEWPNTQRDMISVQSCPGDQATVGMFVLY